MLKIKTKAGFIAAVLIAVIILTTCAHLEAIIQEPIVSLDSTNLTSITLQGTELLCKIKIHNPNRIDIPFPEIDWELHINENSFIKGTILNNNPLKKRDSTIVDVPISLNYLEIFNSIKSLIGNKEANYGVSLAAKFDIPVIGERVWDYKHEGIFPLLQPPKINMPSIKLDKIDFTKADLIFTMDVENPNSFALPMPKMDYDYKISNNSYIKSSVGTGGMLAAAAATPVAIQLSVNYLDLLQKIVALVNANEAPSLLSLNTDFGLPAFPDNVFSELPFNLPILRAPAINFTGISVKPFNILNPTSLDFEIGLEIDNRNNFAMNVKDLTFNFNVNNAQWANTRVSGSPQVPANRRTTIPLTFSINTISMITSIIPMITNQTNFAYTFGGNVSLGATLPGNVNVQLDDFTTPFNFAGTTRISR